MVGVKMRGLILFLIIFNGYSDFDIDISIAIILF